MGWWTDRVVPRITNRLLDAPDVHEMRAQACAGLSGRVLEIGFGSGLNADHYPPEVRSIAAVEPSDLGWRLAGPRVSRLPIPVQRVGLDGQRLSASDGEYDAVLSTFSLCTIPDVRQALAEVRRVLKPGGTFHFAEHGRAPDPSVARWQDRLEPLNRAVAGGCHLTRPIGDLVAEQLTVTDLDTGYAPGPRASRPFSFRYVGRASPRERRVVSADELVALVDRSGAVVGSAERSVVRRENLMHSATAVLVRDPEGRIYVHRRSPDKDWAPGHHDAAAGGVLTLGEEPEASAVRELAEELGIHGAALRPLGLSVYEDGTTRCVEHCFETTWTGPVEHADGEVVWGAWMTLAELGGRLADPDWLFVPDTRALLVRLAREGVGDYAGLAPLG